MNTIGIDVASKKLQIYLSDHPEKSFQIDNQKDAVERFIREMNIRADQYEIGVESTGKYHRITQDVFVRQGFSFRVINPILTNEYIRCTIRKKKTDVSDAKIIARLVERGEGQIITTDELDTTKRSLLRARSRVKKYQKGLKQLIVQLKQEEDSAHLRRSIKKLERLIKNMSKSADTLEQEAMTSDPSPEEELIKTIPGFAQKLAAIVSAEVGDFKRFPSARQLKAFVGIDPRIIQSGNTSRMGKITKRGNPFLRSAFYLAAQVARQHDPELKQFFQKKISEGKHFTLAVCAVARKLCERVFAVIKKNAPYEIRQPRITVRGQPSFS